jgi:hypothetical protein
MKLVAEAFGFSLTASIALIGLQSKFNALWLGHRIRYWPEIRTD